MKKRKGKREKLNKEEKDEGMRQRNQGFEKKNSRLYINNIIICKYYFKIYKKNYGTKL